MSLASNKNARPARKCRAVHQLAAIPEKALITALKDMLADYEAD